ncbi:MAG TPA: hypothetical protein VG294_08920 [Solirubrobacteraceae bacterium]|nr:hypothetical protein [Solirubrobacteraceae bacterium]
MFDEGKARAGRIPRPLAVVVSLLVFLGVSPAIAVAVPVTGTIHGTVTAASTAAAVGNYEVDLYDSSMTELQSTCTGVDGSYGFTGLGTASYFVDFSGKNVCAAASSLAPQWYNARILASNATVVPVTDGADTPNINAALKDGSEITGTVTAAATGLPVANVSVQILAVTGPVLETVCTGPAGTYTAVSLNAGPDIVEFVSDASCGPVESYATQFYNGAATAAGASPVDLGEGTVSSGIDAHLSLTPPPPPPTTSHTLTVSTAGTGSGTVTSSPPGISCPGTCSASLSSGTAVTLTAAPAAGSTFTGWSGAGCSGTGACTLIMTADHPVSATFTRAQVTTTTTPLTPPSCRLVLTSARVLVNTAHHKGTKGKPGQLTLSFTCTQGATVTLTGTVTEKGKGKGTKPKTFHIAAHHASARAGTSGTMTVTLPAAALRGLVEHHSESAVFTLAAANANGHGSTRLAVRRLLTRSR